MCIECISYWKIWYTHFVTYNIMNTNGILQKEQFWNSETLQCHTNTQDLFIVCWGICAIRLFVGGNVDDCFSCPFVLYKVNYILLIINIIKIIFISKVEKSCFVFFKVYILVLLIKHLQFSAIFDNRNYFMVS